MIRHRVTPSDLKKRSVPADGTAGGTDELVVSADRDGRRHGPPMPLPVAAHVAGGGTQ
jgi:hypothetical protein